MMSLLLELGRTDDSDEQSSNLTERIIAELPLIINQS